MPAIAMPSSKPRSPEAIRLLLSLGPKHGQRRWTQWLAIPNPSRTGNIRASGHDAVLRRLRQRSKDLIQHQRPKNLCDAPATCYHPIGRQNRDLAPESTLKSPTNQSTAPSFSFIEPMQAFRSRSCRRAIGCTKSNTTVTGPPRLQRGQGCAAYLTQQQAVQLS